MHRQTIWMSRLPRPADDTITGPMCENRDLFKIHLSRVLSRSRALGGLGRLTAHY